MKLFFIFTNILIIALSAFAQIDLELLKKAERGNAEAQAKLGTMYDYGQGVSQDYNIAFKWYTKAANQGHARSQAELGGLYYNGQGVSQNYNKALEWITKAVKQGDAHAQYWMGIMYLQGLAVTQDFKKAMEWYTKAANQGHNEAKAQLGVMYLNGLGVPIDIVTGCALTYSSENPSGVTYCDSILTQKLKTRALNMLVRPD
jgi:TPR repeat protein